MIVVWKGVWRGTKVAVKRFHKELYVSDHNRKLFRQELDNCASLRHPNIVTFCGATLENGNPLQIITELLEGSLDELIRAASSCIPYLSHGEQVHLAEGIAGGITYLHQRQPTPFVHCDIRPSNILVTRDMSAKVADLGASHIIGASTSAGPLSINYTAPERIVGDQRSQSNPSSDVYSLGVTLTELFTSEAAVRTERDGQLTMIGNPKLQDLCIDATNDVAHDRPTATEMLVRLQELKECEEYKFCSVRRIVMGKVESDAIQLIISDRCAICGSASF
jgi:serine/threonine protein kinase